jgi:5'-3' exonuclease
MGSEIKGMDLIVDGNYVLNRLAFALQKYSSLYGELENALNVAVDNYLNLYGFKNIYIISDYKSSWRKRIYPQYKEKRKEQRDASPVDFDFVFKTYESFKKTVCEKSKRIKLLESQNIEGDDFIHSIIKKRNEEGYSVLFIASDKDLNQEVKFSIGDKTYINVQYKDELTKPILYVPQNNNVFFDEILNTEVDFFSINENYELLNFVKGLMSKTIVEEVDTEKTIFVKIIFGDKSDNIDSVLLTPQKANPLNFTGIGEAGALKIYDNYKKDYPKAIDFGNDIWMEQLYDYILDYKKVLNQKDEYLKPLKERLNINRALVHLDEQYLPQDIKEDIKRLVYE